MKVYALLVAFFCMVPGPLLGLKGAYKIKKGIEQYSFEKAKKGMVLAGALERDEKVKLLELLDERIAQSERFSLSGWDWIQVIAGTLLCLAYGEDAYEVAQKKGFKAALGKSYIGALGCGLVINGLLCRSARKPWNELLKIEVELSQMPEKEPKESLEGAETLPKE